MNFISIIIPVVKNDIKFLTKCINSIKDSILYANCKMEIIIIINGKDAYDPSFLKRDYKIILNNNNLGFAYAANQGLKSAKYEWCLLSCPDIIVYKKTIKKLISHITRKEVVLVAPKVLLTNNSTQPTIIPQPCIKNIFIEQLYLYKIFPTIFRSSLTNRFSYDSKSPKSVDYITAILWLINKKRVLHEGGFDEQFFLYFEDVDLCERLNKKYELIYEPRGLITHYKHQAFGGKVDSTLYISSLYKFLLKYHFRMYSVFGVTIFSMGCFFRLLFWIIITFKRKKTIFAQNKIQYHFDVLRYYFLQLLPSIKKII